MLGVTPTTSMDAVGEKLETNPWISQPVCYKFGREPFFLGAITLSNAIDDSTKGCHIRGLSVESVWVAYVDRCKKHMHRVYQVFPAGCTSIRIAATLEYESLLVLWSLACR
jgi:hypothetical protein